jgi:hypothetical protein
MLNVCLKSQYHILLLVLYAKVRIIVSRCYFVHISRVFQA